MKKKLMNIATRTFLLMVMLFTNVVAFAQEEGANVVTKSTRTTSSSTTEWYSMPWVWVVGGAVFILLLTAILRGSDRRTDA